MVEKAAQKTDQETPVFKKIDNAGIGNLAGDHIAAMSEPSEHAIAAEQEDTDKNAGIVDKSGTPFNPDFHATDDSGNPLYTQAGNFRKKPGRKPGQGPASSLNTNTTRNTSTQDSGHDGAYMSAVATVDSVGMVAQMLGGEMYAYQRILAEDKKTVLLDERESGIESFTQLYRQKGVKDIPPGVAVTIWAIMFLAPRLRKDARTKSKLKLAWYWLKSKITRKPMPKKQAEKETKKEGD